MSASASARTASGVGADDAMATQISARPFCASNSRKSCGHTVTLRDAMGRLDPHGILPLPDGDGCARDALKCVDEGLKLKDEPCWISAGVLESSVGNGGASGMDGYV